MSSPTIEEKLAGWAVSSHTVNRLAGGRYADEFTIEIVTSNTLLDDLFTGYRVSTGNTLERTFSGPLGRDFFTEFEGKGCKVLIHSDKHPVPAIADGTIHQQDGYRGRTVILFGVHRRTDIDDIPLPTTGSAKTMDFLLGWGCKEKEMEEALTWLLDQMAARS